MLTGWQTIDGKKYYFRPSTTNYGRKGSMVTGRVSIDGTIYNFGTNGVLVMDYTYLLLRHCRIPGKSLFHLRKLEHHREPSENIADCL